MLCRATEIAGMRTKGFFFLQGKGHLFTELCLSYYIKIVTSGQWWYMTLICTQAEAGRSL